MRWKTRLAALAVVTGVAVGVVGSASATFGTPKFTASITPSTTLVAGATQPFTVTVTNTSTGGWYAPRIKKVTVTPPSTAWASPVTKSLAYPYLETGSSTTVGVNADVPCTTTGDWNVAVVFSYGSATPKTLTTTVPLSTQCTLAFGTQPQDALTNALVTGSDLNPNGPPVTVEVRNGAGDLFTPPSAQVQLSDPAISAVVTGGVATFMSGLVFATPWTNKTLSASAFGFVATDATSDPFEIIDFDTSFGGSLCLDLNGDSTAVDCSSKTTTGVSKDTVANVDVVESTLDDTDVLVRAIPDGEQGLCPTTYGLGRGELLVRPLAGTQLIEILMPKRVRQASTNNGVSQIDVCIETNAEFTTKGGGRSTPYDTGTVHWGVLPTCASSDPQQPCVKTRESWSNGGARVVFVVPYVGDGAYDPKWGVN